MNVGQGQQLTPHESSKMRYLHIVLFILLLGPVFGEEMVTLQFYLTQPEGLDRTPRTLYRVGKTHLRMESENRVNIHRDFDIWDIDSNSGRATYSRDPDGEVKVWLFPPEELPTSFRDLEPGFELDFLQQHPFESRGQDSLDGTPCQLKEWQEGESSVQIWLRSNGTPIQLEVSHQGTVVLQLRYDSYTLGEPDYRLFQLPPGSKLVSNSQPLPSGSAVYEPWAGDICYLYGSQLTRYRDMLEEDLEPTLEAATQTSTLTLKQALEGDLSKDQWPSLLAACNGPIGAELSAPLARLSRQDPDPTDRALAYRLLAQIGDREALRAGLLDAYLSNRLLCMELLKEPVGDMTILMPPRPRGPFHTYFVTKALARHLPNAKASEFFSLKPTERAQKLPPAALNSFLELARAEPSSPFAACVLYLFGSEDESLKSLETLATVLLDQGSGPDSFQSPEFWLRGDIIQVLSSSSDGERLLELFRSNLETYTPEKEMLLLALAYALDSVTAKGAELSLARVRDLTTDNYDLYLAAALALSNYDRTEARTSLLHVLSLKKQPFVTMAVARLEQMADQRTPGWNGRGLYPDPEQALEFWQKWNPGPRTP